MDELRNRRLQVRPLSAALRRYEALRHFARRLCKSQMITDASVAQDAMDLPLLETATQRTGPACANSRTCSAVATSHARTVLSQLPETSVLPSGENATELTLPAWPWIVRRGWPLDTSHRWIVPSQHPEASVLPSGAKAIDMTKPGSSFIWPICLPVERSQRRMECSALPEASRLPS